MGKEARVGGGRRVKNKYVISIMHLEKTEFTMRSS